MNMKKNSFLLTAKSVLFITLVVIVCVLVNLFTNMLAAIVPMHIDMSEERLLNISDQTRGFLETLDTDIAVYIIATENQTPVPIARLLEKYRLINRRIHIHYVDVDVNPNFALRYNNQGFLEKNSIIIESDKRFTIITYDSLFLRHPNNGNVIGFMGEQRITSAILYTLSDNVSSISLIDGHNEIGLPNFYRMLHENNIQLERTNLLVSGINPNARLAIINGPTVDFSPLEIERLWRFCNDGGALFIILNPSAPRLPNLEEFVNAWGVAFNNNYVVDRENHAFGNIRCVLATMEDLPFNQQFNHTSRILVAPYSGTLEVLFGQRGDVRVTTLLSSTANAYAKREGYQGLTDIYEPGDVRGPIPLLFLSERTVYVGGTEINNKVLVGGSVDFLSDAVFIDGLLNAEYGLALIYYLLGDVDLIHIPARFYTAGILNIDVSQAAAVGRVITYGFPAASLGIGFCILWRRRRR